MVDKKIEELCGRRNKEIKRGKMIRCKFCKSTDITNAGFIVLKEGRIQRYQCRKCKKMFRLGTNLIYTPKLVEFMRKCAEKGLTSGEAKEKCELKFKRTLSILSFRSKASKLEIPFHPPYETIDPSIKEFIKKHKEIDIYILRDKIIERFEENISLTKIRRFH